MVAEKVAEKAELLVVHWVESTVALMVVLMVAPMADNLVAWMADLWAEKKVV